MLRSNGCKVKFLRVNSPFMHWMTRSESPKTSIGITYLSWANIKTILMTISSQKFFISRPIPTLKEIGKIDNSPNPPLLRVPYEVP